MVDTNHFPEKGCTCNENEFVTELCPVHSKKSMKDIKQPAVITDGYLVDAQKMKIEGWLYQCPECNTSAIFVNSGYLPKHCCECGEPILLNSKVFTDAIRAEQSINANEIAVANLM
jgi:hypothetical protein